MVGSKGCLGARGEGRRARGEGRGARGEGQGARGEGRGARGVRVTRRQSVRESRRLAAV